MRLRQMLAYSSAVGLVTFSTHVADAQQGLRACPGPVRGPTYERTLVRDTWRFWAEVNAPAGTVFIPVSSPLVQLGPSHDRAMNVNNDGCQINQHNIRCNVHMDSGANSRKVEFFIIATPYYAPSQSPLTPPC